MLTPQKIFCQTITYHNAGKKKDFAMKKVCAHPHTYMNSETGLCELESV